LTPKTLNQAALVLAAAREVGEGSVEQMKAIAICLRNREKAGWADDILGVIELMDETAAHDDQGHVLDGANRELQRLTHDIEQVYYEGGADLPDAEGEGLHDAKYWCFLTRPIRDWFRDQIIRDPENHPNRAQVGPIMFYD
jgi:hypothetical protein